MNLLDRPSLQQTLERALARSRVVVLLGPRQCGKTTLARQRVSADSINYFDLEDPVSLARLEQPMTALQDLRGLVVIDEVQRRPDIFPILRVLCDRTPLPGRFLILGSASPELLHQSSESLAGRVEIVQMMGFSLADVGAEAQSAHWLRGGFPLAFLAASEADSLAWRRNFIQTFVERDLPQLGISIPAANILRFWNILTHYHGQVWNAAEAGRAVGVGEPAVRRYLDLLQGVFMARQLAPWYANLAKRQVKSPKIYFRDSGIFHQMLGVHNERDLLTHPKSGASWEGYVIEEVSKLVNPDEAYFWATHAGAELDLLLLKDGRRIGVECKRVDAPRFSPSMRIALTDLELDHLFVIYPGSRAYPLADNVTVLPLAQLAQGKETFLSPLF